MDSNIVPIEIIYLLYMLNVMLLSVRCNKQMNSLLFNEDKTIIYLLDYKFMVPKKKLLQMICLVIIQVNTTYMIVHLVITLIKYMKVK